VKWSLLTIAAMLALGFSTRYAGLDATMGLAFASTGVLFPFFSPLLGWLGVALTGSDTSSNVLFGGLQRISAERLGLSPILACAAKSSGGVMGKMIDAQSIVVASVATGQQGNEGEILRYVFWHSIALAARAAPVWRWPAPRPSTAGAAELRELSSRIAPSRTSPGLPSGRGAGVRLLGDRVLGRQLKDPLTGCPGDRGSGRRGSSRARAGRSAHGMAVDARKRPLAGVEVTVRPSPAGSGPDGAATVLTDDRGRFEVPALPAHRVDLEARRQGFAPTVVPGVAVAPGPGTADLGTLTLLPGVRIEGRVADAAGRPLAGTGAWLTEGDRAQAGTLRQREPDARTDEAGRFAVTDLARGRRVNVLVAREGYVPSWVAGVEAPTAKPLAVVLEPASRLRGRVEDASGEPVPGASVRLRPAPPPPGTVGLELRRSENTADVQAGPDGTFTFAEVAPGAVTLEASAEGFVPPDPVAVRVPPDGAAQDVVWVSNQASWRRWRSRRSARGGRRGPLRSKRSITRAATRSPLSKPATGTCGRGFSEGGARPTRGWPSRPATARWSAT
jgi:hypothetical protein